MITLPVIETAFPATSRVSALGRDGDGTLDRWS